MEKNSKKIKNLYLKDEQLIIIINKKGKLYAMGMSMKVGFPRSLYILLMSFFSTLRIKLRVPVSADTQRELNGSIQGITFENRKITAQEIATWKGIHNKRRKQ